ncbi:unnamed protein product, partial [Aureobasidium mustum]
MARLSGLFVFLTLLLSLFAISTSAAPTTFAEVEESWQRGQHPTPSYHSHLPSHQHSNDYNDGNTETAFQGMLDERTMAVRRKLHNVIGRRGVFGVMFGGKAEVERREEIEVLRPVRNRRWQF